MSAQEAALWQRYQLTTEVLFFCFHWTFTNLIIKQVKLTLSAHLQMTFKHYFILFNTILVLVTQTVKPNQKLWGMYFVYLPVFTLVCVNDMTLDEMYWFENALAISCYFKQTQIKFRNRDTVLPLQSLQRRVHSVKCFSNSQKPSKLK